MSKRNSSSTSSSGFSTVSLLKNIGAKLASALSFFSNSNYYRKRSSRKVSSSSLGRSRSYAERLDSQRAEAIEDCIEFLNSSASSLQRSYSVPSSTCC
uniref:Uncharacterized protein LOC104234519 n=1 Tax=Nicotiana sylvestris TaxID=4096 RepID=A0A1U7X2L4_NICSY|nr:PREDICTED: uncharacterized protein LOC104234519 [Nicotiana sylvestris]